MRKSTAPLDKLLLYLVDTGRISVAERLKAGHLAHVHRVSILDALVSEGWLTPEDLLTARCACFGATHVRLDLTPPDKSLLETVGPEWCLRHRVLPWRRLGGRTVWVTSTPELFDQMKWDLPNTLGDPILAVAAASEIEQAIARAFRREMTEHAETALPAAQSCRNWAIPPRALVLSVFAALAVIALAGPAQVLSVAILFAIALVAINVVFKTVLSAAALLQKPLQPRSAGAQPLSRITVLVPLLREPEVAAKLLSNLQRLKYPRGLLEVIFVVEQDDDITKTTLSHLHLPYSFRMLEVPQGSVRTKPRALNYALPFCRGEVIGVYDAEDKPASDQLLKVAEAFRNVGPDVACLQGRLGFFNTRSGLLTRCFTAEYAGWFGLQLKGLSALGLPVPLGGTTLFLRRDALDRLGRWDAHNVTEDADLGMRLHRAGYRTALIDTETEEEATSTMWSWVRQRSRWIKGFMMTYAVHMRRPAELWKELGPAGFVAFQVLFLGSVLGALTMPLLLVMVAAFLGAPVPGLSEYAIRAAGRLMIGLEVVNLAVWAAGIRQRKHRHLAWILPLLHVYFLMASVAAAKALVELISSPFYWDKTGHGVTTEDT